jgi:hypothetical protein
MATVKSIIEDVYTKVNGEYEQVPEGSDDFKTYLITLNQAMNAWFDYPYVKWQGLFNFNFILPELIEIGKLSYTVPNTCSILVGNSPYDSVYVLGYNKSTVGKYKMTDQALFDASRAEDVCTILGDKLVLKSVPLQYNNYSLRLPVYMRPKEYTSGSEEVMIPNKSWLIAYMAATLCDASPVPFIARNADKFYKQADIFMKQMRKNNSMRQHLFITGAGGQRDGHQSPFEEIMGGRFR